MPAYTFQGVGKSQFRSLDGSSLICEFLYNQDLTIQLEKSTQKWYGGDGIFPIDMFDTDASGMVSLTAARFDMKYADAFDTGAQSTGADEFWELSEKILVPAGLSATLEHGADLVASSDTLRMLNTTKDVYEPMTRVVIAPAASGEYQITVAGVITFHADDAGKTVLADYKYDVTNTEAATIKTVITPQYGMFIHQGGYLSNEIIKRVQTVIYKCRFRGSIQFDWKRGEASAPKLEFEIFDADRADQAAIKIARVAA